LFVALVAASPRCDLSLCLCGSTARFPIPDLNRGGVPIIAFTNPTYEHIPKIRRG
jgi:hypothetical protein